MLLLSHASFAESALKLEAAPILGPSTPSVDGWGEVYVRIENGSSLPVAGFVELRGSTSSSGVLRTLSRAPFAMAGKGRVNLLLPSHSLVARLSEAKVLAVDNRGEQLSSVQLPPVRGLDPLLFDLSVPSHMAPVLSSQLVAVHRRTSGDPLGGAALSVSTPQVNPATGEPVLPDLAAGYASTTLVLASGRVISSLSPAASDALFSWVLAGGALALVIDRPEDARSQWLEALAGGRVHSCAAKAQLASATQFAVPVDGGSRMGTAIPLSLQLAKPSAELVATFTALCGGNLRATPWGDAASYGLGEVHFLAFNPDSELGAGDAWAKYKVLDLLRHAWERASTVALPHGQGSLEDSRAEFVRRVLDPNQSTRWTVVVSTLLLLIYAGLAGPLNFFLAQRAGKPLRALWHLPLWSALAMVSIVVLGVLGKGVTGRARHLTLIEAGAGMPRGAVTRFRGLYGSRADDVTVRAARGSVLDVMGEPDEIARDLLIDRDGLRLEKLRQKPWEMQIVREDGFANLGAGVSLWAGTDGEISIKNRCARDLLGVIVKAPGLGLTYFPKVADGETVNLRKGRSIGPLPMSSLGARRALAVDSFREQVEERARGAAAAWDALERLTASEVDWWPEDVPTLIAELEGGEGRTKDSGLRLDVDRVLVRVVGFGGVP